MDELKIDYSSKGFIKTFSLLFAGYSTLFGLYLSIKDALIKNYSIIFFCSLVLIILAIIVILYFTLWQSKPLLILNNNHINVNILDQKKSTITWDDVVEVSIGISSFIFVLKNKKRISIDLSMLKYKDLKQSKTRIIELCEEKEIPFHNI